MRRAAKRDANEGPIVEALEAAGWHVHRCSDEGLPDLYCIKVTQGAVYQRWLEVKTTGGTLRPAQARLWDEWEANCVHVHVVESVDDVKRLCAGEWQGRDWRNYPVDERGRGAKKPKPKRWIPLRLRAKVTPRRGT